MESNVIPLQDWANSTTRAWVEAFKDYKWPEHPPFDIDEAAKLWRAGCDTQKIADLLHVDEADIWNRLTEIRRA
jgi:hypothetical protein